MATIRKRGSKWQVQIRRTGFPTLSKSFNRKADAVQWATQCEIAADRRELPIVTKVLDTFTLGDLVRRYRDEVTSRKRGKDDETIVLNAFLREKICRKKLSVITTQDFAEYRDSRLQEVSGSTLARQLSPLSNMYNIARSEWGLPLQQNPISKLRVVAAQSRRARRLQAGELDALLDNSKKSRNGTIIHIVQLALETGMRRGELLQMKWAEVDLTHHTVLIPKSKNGFERTIPLTPKALDLLRRQDTEKIKVFDTSENALRLGWKRLVKRSGLTGLRFHDLRHEAISSFFELGLTVPEVAAISGHRDIRMVMRYAHADWDRVKFKISSRKPDS